MTIGIDIDEVLAEFLSALISYHNTTFGTTFTKDQFRSPRYSETWGGTRDEAIQKVYDFHATPYFEAIRPVPGSQEAVRVLRVHHDLHVITSRPHDIAEATSTWLHRNFPDTFASIHHTNHYSQSGESTTKLQVCDMIGADVLIEDSLDFAMECLSPNRKILLLDCPWNANTELPNGIVRVHSWKEITGILRQRIPTPQAT
ncbi:MAG: hypothetical protein Q7S02_02585 [bacterium]|nr:hypothetical protein [bacterium]